jgi:hypothetical protein
MIFGSVLYALIPDLGRRKRELKAIKGLYVGECEQQKAYSLQRRENILYCHVKIYEINQNVEATTSNRMHDQPDAAPTKRGSKSFSTSRHDNVTHGSSNNYHPSTHPEISTTYSKETKRQRPMDSYVALLSPHKNTTKNTVFIYNEPKSFKEAMASSVRDCRWMRTNKSDLIKRITF